MDRIQMTIEGREWVAIPAEEYRRLAGEPPSAQEDAVAYTRAGVASDLRAARETAGLSQAVLAKRMGKSQALVSRAEAGDTKVGVRYVEAVLKACKLPKDWSPPR